MPVHPTALIDTATRIDESAFIGPFAVVEGGVEIGARTRVEAHAVVRSGTILGDDCVVDSHCVIGGLPQDLSFDAALPTGVRIGNRVTLREGVTVSRATKEGAFTEIGDDCFLMANSHVAHDCRLATRVILANGVLLAGHIQIGARSFLGGAVAVHQFVRIGESAMVSGLSRVSREVPPFAMMAERDEWIGLNLVGLKRQGKSRETIAELKSLMRDLWTSEKGMIRRAGELFAEGRAQTPEGIELLKFMSSSKRGFCQPRRRRGREDNNDE